MNVASPSPHQDATSGNWESNWNEFRSALDEAIAKLPNEYFRVRRYGDDDPEPRERAYCYELYHQLRLQLRADFPYSLHGEIDKAGHLEILKCFGPRSRPNPDFILHKPTLMGHGDNLGIIEVKASDENPKAVAKDLRKIQKFLKCVGYQRGVMLFFGAESPQSFAPLNGVEFLWHRAVGEKPLVVEGVMKPTSDGKVIFRDLVRSVLNADRSLLKELKEEFSSGSMPGLYGSASGIRIQSEADVQISRLAPEARALLQNFVLSRKEGPRISSEAIVAEIMRRAHAVAFRDY